MSKRNKELDDAVAALRPEMIAALQRLIRKPSVEASPLPGKPFGADVDACFTEALTHMTVGSKWVVYIPYSAGYGAQKTGPIEPFSNLIFTIELLEVNPAPQAPRE